MLNNDKILNWNSNIIIFGQSVRKLAQFFKRMLVSKNFVQQTLLFQKLAQQNCNCLYLMFVHASVVFWSYYWLVLHVDWYDSCLCELDLSLVSMVWVSIMTLSKVCFGEANRHFQKFSPKKANFRTVWCWKLRNVWAQKYIKWNIHNQCGSNCLGYYAKWRIAWICFRSR